MSMVSDPQLNMCKEQFKAFYYISTKSFLSRRFWLIIVVWLENLVLPYCRAPKALLTPEFQFVWSKIEDEKLSYTSEINAMSHKGKKEVVLCTREDGCPSGKQIKK